MPENSGVEKRYVWDDVAQGLTVTGTTKQEDEEIKSGKRKLRSAQKSKIYCPHANLVLNFHETLNPSQKINFRKRYLRKVSPDEPNVIILQDVKDLVMYLAIGPMTLQFIHFFHLPVIDRFLRALIIYFQYYAEIWEEIKRKRVATVRKAPNPLAGGVRLRRAEELRVLRCVLGREYSELIIGSDETAAYHHMKAGASSSESQGEKDLRIFEILITMAHRVVWIALQRKYYNLIEVEMHRLFRTDVYNTADRRSGGTVNKGMLEDELRILQGPKMPLRRKLLRNSPLPYQIIYNTCDYRVLSLGMIAVKTKDPRIVYLENALLAPEEKLPELGVKVGILGHSRNDYDVILMPSNSDENIEEQEDEKEKWEKRRSSLVEKILRSMHPDRSGTKMPSHGANSEFLEVFPVGIMNMRCKGHDRDRENARKKWVARELRRQADRLADTTSIATLVDFLEKNVELWTQAESYQENQTYFKRLSVVNDVAERGVALVDEYNKRLTTNEEQLQYLLQVVKNHRKKYPTCNKQNFI